MNWEVVCCGDIYGKVVGTNDNDEVVNVEVVKGTVITISGYAIQTLLKN